MRTRRKARRKHETLEVLMRRVATIAVVSALALAVLALRTPAAHATAFHFYLVKSMPDKEVVLEAAPAEIKLWFSEEAQKAGTSIRLVGPDEALVELADVLRSDEDATLVTAKVTGRIPPGVSKVVWRAMGRDGHIVRGEYTFTVHSADATGY